MNHSWTVEKTDTATKITISPEISMETTTVPSTNAQTPSEIARQAYMRGKTERKTLNQLTGGLNLSSVSPHVHDFVRLCKTKAPIHSYKAEEGELKPTAGQRNGYDWIIQKECACLERIAVEIRRVVL